MGIEVRVEADSINSSGERLVTMVWKYQRYAHADVMTHRDFSRNGASSRAIPINQMLKAVLVDPAIPEEWGMNGKGMAAHGKLPAWRAWICRQLWLKLRYVAVAVVWLLLKLKLHKQWANRLLEPWLWMTIVMSSTQFKNFLKQRDDKAAMPELQVLAKKVRAALEESSPTPLDDGEWHIPFLTPEERGAEALARLRYRSFVRTGAEYPFMKQDLETIQTLVKKGCARAARVSYIKHDMIKSTEEDMQRCDSLVKEGHWSPLEHAAYAASYADQVGNFQGWIQYRKTFWNESGRF